MQSKETGMWPLILRGGASGMEMVGEIELATGGTNLFIVRRDRRANMPQVERNFHISRPFGDFQK
jgi:hypothetical protein